MDIEFIAIDENWKILKSFDDVEEIDKWVEKNTDYYQILYKSGDGNFHVYK